MQMLERLSEIALANCTPKQQPEAAALGLPKEERYLFGHKVMLDSLQTQTLNLQVKQQIITDWQAAAHDLKEMFIEKGFTKPLVVPLATFKKVCQTCQLIQLEDMDENGMLFLNPLMVDDALTSLAGIPTHLFFPGTREHGLTYWWNRSLFRDRLFTNDNRHDISLASGGLRIAGIAPQHVLMCNEFFGRLFFKKGNDREQYIAEQKKRLQKKIEWMAQPYNLYSLVLRKDCEKINTDFFKGKAVFAELPEEFQRMLYELKSKFPYWPVYTAADPSYFRLMMGDLDVGFYAKERAQFWSEILDDLLSKAADHEAIHRDLQQQFLEHMQALGLSQKYSHVFYTLEDVLRAIEIEKDPIFYLPIEKFHKHVKYRFAVVYGQTGDSPHEKEAISQLQKIDHEAFLGVAAN